jgi:Outer membrane protein beta-barrel domain
LNNQNASRIVPAMKRTSLLLALIVLIALPAVAQSNELGIVVGGSRRFVDGAPKEAGVEFDDSTFSLSNNSFDLFWGIQMEPDLYLKFKGGRIQGPVAVGYTIPGDDKLYRKDVEGEVQHIEANVEYRFDEPYGSTGLFGGVGYYRQTASGSDSTANYGVNGGVNADFPLSRRYGIVLEGTYHWTNSHFQSRFMTAGVGLRVSF